ncbi:MAG: hypothetical protein LBD33_01155 [Puniceicoccales bacterium]|jgi:hypothetical protein|nr:hypothetical protein [Puniceicoccales bacterium]
MRILVLAAAVVDGLRKTCGINSQISEYIRKNNCDKILLCGTCRHGCCLQFDENIPVEKITAAKLFGTLKNIAKGYKSLRTIAVIHFNEQKIIENYLKNSGRLHVCFINLDNRPNKYAGYTYADINLDSNYLSVKFREYNGKLPIVINVYELPFVEI